jgi:hypothetical protein
MDMSASVQGRVALGRHGRRQNLAEPLAGTSHDATLASGPGGHQRPGRVHPRGGASPRPDLSAAGHAEGEQVKQGWMNGLAPAGWNSRSLHPVSRMSFSIVTRPK